VTDLNQAPRVPRPADRAHHAAWMAYAVSEGFPVAAARRMTRDELRSSLSRTHKPLTGVPLLERHEAPV
jgi:hypothetical protein